MAFPPQTIAVTFNTSPVLTYALSEFRNDTDPSAAVDTTDYEFELVVTNDDGDEMFRLEGVVTATTVTFTFTPSHTGWAPGSYDAELRWWNNPTPPRGLPLDAVPLTFRVNPSVGI